MSWRTRLGPLFGLAVALQFFTRLPMPRDLDPELDDLGHASPWFPIVGVIVGGVMAAMAMALSHSPLVPGAQLVIILTLGVLLTGGFHEDGLADTLDGLGGGWTLEDKLRIMRDSRIGSYGALALILMFGWRAGAMLGMAPSMWPIALILAHLLGRWSTLPLLLTMPYARMEEPGKAKPLVEAVSLWHVLIGSALTLIICAALALKAGLIAALVAAIVTLLGGLIMRAKLKGITGDTLGAINIACELTTLMTFAAMAPSTSSPWL